MAQTTPLTPAAIAVVRSRRRNLGLFPPPLWGRVREGGRSICAGVAPCSTPTPNPSPQRGGEPTELTAPPVLSLTSRARSPPCPRPCRRNGRGGTIPRPWPAAATICPA